MLSKMISFIKNRPKLFGQITSILFVILIWIKFTFSPLTRPMRTDELDAFSRLFHIIYLPMSNVWLLGFQYIMRIFSLIPDNGTFLNYRLGIYIFAILSSIVIYLIVHKVTKNWIYSLLALIIFLFHPLTVQLSVLTLSEIPWTFFILLSIYFLFFSDNKRQLFLGLTFYVISETIRYESWFMLPILFVYLFFHFKKDRTLFIPSVFYLLCFPIIWLNIEYQVSGSPVSFIFEKMKCSVIGKSDLSWHMHKVITTVDKQLSVYIFPYLIILSLLVASFFLKNKKLISFSIGSIYLLACFIFQTYISFNENISPRFFYYFVPLIAVLVPTCLSQVINFKNNKILNYIFIIPILLIVLRTTQTEDHLYYSQLSEPNLTTFRDLDSINLKSNETVSVCTNDERIINLLEYKLGYKNFTDCKYKLYLNENMHGKLMIKRGNDYLYNDLRKWVSKTTFQDYVLYEF